MHYLPSMITVSLLFSGKKSSSGSRQRRTGGFTNQAASIDISDRMFLGGRIQSNLPTVQEEDQDSYRHSVASTDSSFSQVLTGGQEGGSLEAEATHQLVTLVMDFLSYPGAEKGAENSSFVKTESYEVVQMSHYLGVLMGYDIKVGEFTGNPRRLRYVFVFTTLSKVKLPYLTMVVHERENHRYPCTQWSLFAILQSTHLSTPV